VENKLFEIFILQTKIFSYLGKKVTVGEGSKAVVTTNPVHGALAAFCPHSLRGPTQEGQKRTAVLMFILALLCCREVQE
jgi:hypothetical protein